MLDVALRIAYLSAISLSLYTSGWLLIKADKNRTTGALAACQLLIIIWCIPQLFSALPMTKGMKYLAYGISYIGISFIGPAWLEFAFLYSKRKLGHGAELVLFIIGAVNYSVLLTNEYHHLFYTWFEVEQVVYGPVFYIHMVYTYLCVLAGMAVVLRAFKKNQVAVSHIVVILLSAALPLGFNLLYMTGLVRIGFDLTPPAFALSSILMLLAVFRYDFLDVNTMAFDKLFDSISEGVVVYSRRGKITYCNGMVRRWFGLEAGDSVERLWTMLESKGVPVDQSSMGDRTDEKIPVITWKDAEGSRRLEIKRYSHCDKKGNVAAGTVIFTDVNRYYQLLEQGRELAVSNQMLATQQERNRIAQDVHDTTGHTLTMINSLLKLIRIEYEKQSGPQAETKPGSGDTIEEYLLQAQKLAGDGIRELRCSINNLRQLASWGLITQGVHQLAESVKEIEVEVDIQGEDKPEYSCLSPVVYECLREAITNCLKYAGATHMDVILKFGSGFLNFYIFDNGKGCANIQDGNGIRGIRQRVEQAGGTVRILSEKGEGFQIYIRLPVPDSVSRGDNEAGAMNNRSENI